jgi:hypothetical protein
MEEGRWVALGRANDEVAADLVGERADAFAHLVWSQSGAAPGSVSLGLQVTPSRSASARKARTCSSVRSAKGTGNGERTGRDGTRDS